MAVLKACPRCKTLIPAGMPYCATCAPIVDAQRALYREENARKKAALYNRRRDPKYGTFYRSKEWKVTSRAKLQSVSYKCEKCGGLAVEVHHKTPIQTLEGWETRLEWDGLQALCTACHNAAHDRGKRKQEQGIIDMHDVMRTI